MSKGVTLELKTKLLDLLKNIYTYRCIKKCYRSGLYINHRKSWRLTLYLLW